MLVGNLSRIGALSLRLSRSERPDNGLILPSLHTLVIRAAVGDKQEPSKNPFVSSILYGQAAPQLETLSFCDRSFQWPRSFRHPQMRELRISAGFSEAPWSLKAILDTLDTMPLLEVLVIDGCFDEDATLLSPSKRTVTLNNIKSIKLASFSSPACIQLFSHMDIPPSTSVMLTGVAISLHLLNTFIDIDKFTSTLQHLIVRVDPPAPQIKPWDCTICPYCLRFAPIPEPLTPLETPFWSLDRPCKSPEFILHPRIFDTGRPVQSQLESPTFANVVKLTMVATWGEFIADHLTGSVIPFPNVRQLHIYNTRVWSKLFDVLAGRRDRSQNQRYSEDRRFHLFPFLQELKMENTDVMSHDEFIAFLQERKTCSLGVQRIELVNVKFKVKEFDILPLLRELVPDVICKGVRYDCTSADLWAMDR